ncbi:MAG: HDOD domain-containing protein [Methylophilaceae bacterium]
MNSTSLQSSWAASEKSALQFLLHGGSDNEFPALSSTISEINKVVASESESTNRLTKTILQDVALTNRLLKLVNTVSYGQFGGKINTISKAVVILGFETVRNVAMTLILLEFLQNKSQAASLKDEVIASFFAGLVASKLSVGRNVRDSEEAMICAMFQNLGKLLATFYFYDECQEIAQLVQQGLPESRAAHQVLGISYNELGQEIAKHWNFPDRLLSGMQTLAGERIKKPYSELDHLNITVNLANELCRIAANTSPAEKEKALKTLLARYSAAVSIDEQQLGKALNEGLEEISVRASIINLPTAQSPLLKTISQWTGHEKETVATAEPDDGMLGITPLDTAAEAVSGIEAVRHDPESILSAGIQDVTNTLVVDFNLNDILQMVLETMYRGMNFHRVLIFVRDGKTNTMRARFGFGVDIDRVLPKMHFPIPFEPDVFHVAMEKGVDIVIEDVAADNIASKIPAWYRAAVQAQCFLLLPVMINGKAIGLFYADMATANTLQVSQRQLSLLRTLRNQAVLAIKQKQ